ncbi:MAG: type I-D CRISPR-associated protein Csc1 [Thermoprotei archaeon]|nr:MAG: type I-D CRISPR-associated protein Csc1 [Thermoprotei archaeon]
MLRAYIADMELQGVLIFATEQRPSLAEEGGAIITTGHYIHNYPLIYGLAGRSIEAYAVIPSLHFLSYQDLEKSPFKPKLAKESLHYGFIEVQLKNLLSGRESIYVFPAFPQRVTPKKFFMQAKGSGYAEFRGALKTVYPRLVHYVALIPPTDFKTIVLANNIELPRVLYMRIGMKRMGLFKVRLKEAEIHKKIEDPVWTNVPVNLYDIGLFGYTPIDVMKVMETRSKAPNKLLASTIGYIRTRKLFLIKGDKEEYRIPLPLKLMGATT